MTAVANPPRHPTAASRSRDARAGGVARSGASAASVLGKHTGSSSTAGQAGADQGVTERRCESRSRRARLMAVQRETSSVRRKRLCGRFSRTGDGVMLRGTNTAGGLRPGIAGLMRCGCRSCVDCAPKIAAHNGGEIVDMLESARQQNHSVIFYTFTAAHRLAMRLAFLLMVITKAWGSVTKGRPWRADVATFGITGWVRVIETTRSILAGWHPHQHGLTFVDGPISHELAGELVGRMFDRWDAALRRFGLHAIAERGGMHYEVVDLNDLTAGHLGRYLSKVGMELTSASTKHARKEGSRTPLEILGDFADTGLVDDLELVAEHERAVHGKRMITYSRDVRKLYALPEVESSDEEIANADLQGEDLIALPSETWEQMWSRAHELLNALESGGVTAAVAWLDVRGLHWDRPVPSVARPRSLRARALRAARPPGAPPGPTRPGGPSTSTKGRP